MSNAQAATNQQQSAGNKGSFVTSMDIKDCHCNESLRAVVGDRPLSQCAQNIIRTRGLSLDA